MVRAAVAGRYTDKLFFELGGWHRDFYLFATVPGRIVDVQVSPILSDPNPEPHA